MLLKGNLRYADDTPMAWLGYTVQAAYLLPRTALFEESATLSENKEKSAPPNSTN
jgi:hypothetical protein